ncbi:MAG TPA: hypothetical protein VFL17_03820 [Anaerolineae bacterium]|nr:hypothetical protein [Anaerolineae bacterium]
MQLTHHIRVAAIGAALLVAAFLSGTQFGVAQDVSPDQLLLKVSDLPQGAQVQIQGPLTPGAWSNGFVNKDGTDIVQGYIDGARADFMVPLVQVESTSGTQSMARTYIANFVYRFADRRSAANEFQRLQSVFSSAATPTDAGSSGRQSVIFEVGGDEEVPYATMRWLFVLRGKFLIVLAMPGPLQNSALGAAKQSNDMPLTEQAIDGYNQAIDDLFAANMALLQGR